MGSWPAGLGYNGAGWFHWRRANLLLEGVHMWPKYAVALAQAILGSTTLLSGQGNDQNLRAPEVWVGLSFCRPANAGLLGDLTNGATAGGGNLDVVLPLDKKATWQPV